MKLSVETTFSIGDLVQSVLGNKKDKDIGVIHSIEVRHTVMGTVVRYSVKLINRDGELGWCHAQALEPYIVEKEVTIKDKE